MWLTATATATETSTLTLTADAAQHFGPYLHSTLPATTNLTSEKETERAEGKREMFPKKKNSAISKSSKSHVSVCWLKHCFRVDICSNLLCHFSICREYVKVYYMRRALQIADSDLLTAATAAAVPHQASMCCMPLTLAVYVLLSVCVWLCLVTAFL